MSIPKEESESLAKRLRRQVLIDFRREPLQEALTYIGSEVQVSVVTDGDALKLAGFTQNMPQTHALGKVSAITAIDAILRQYGGKMVIVLDETRQEIFLTTQDAALAQGLTVFDTSVADRNQ